MHLGIHTDGLARLLLKDALEFAANLHVDGLELATGNWSMAPHVRIAQLSGSAVERRNLRQMLSDYGLRLLALNANGNQLHPIEGAAHDAVVRQTMRLAAEMEVETVVLMSGLPAGCPGDRAPNWITTSWPPEAVTMLNYQWHEVAIPYWQGLAREAEALGLRLAVEMHGRQLVHNPATYRRLKEAVGSEAVGVNLDPSHLIWQGCDPIAVIEELGPELAHVHAKDARIEPRRTVVNGYLDALPPSKVGSRTWNYVTLGNGRPGGAEFWREFIYALHAAGYQGAVCVEHEDVLVSGKEGVHRAVELLRPMLFLEEPDWTPADF